VLDYAGEVNYQPNPIALSLKENKSRAIGVIVPEIANNFFPMRSMASKRSRRKEDTM
jgi:DNA-binding LacI/PurR family transcriptional regulator